MNTEQRGSEKLMATCSEMSTLSQEELDRVAGGALLSSPIFSVSQSYWKVFPRGIPWPEIFNHGGLDKVKEIAEVGQPY
ncbi:MAG: hypothetical protein QNJ91_09650 [Gammaproteobacteria bacterium]|nr:hypothetical protein [Gammaproteobacteria bacterium]